MTQYDQGLHALRMAGLETLEALTGPTGRAGANRSGYVSAVGIDITLPSTVLEKIRMLDSDVRGLDSEIAANVKRQSFLDMWTAYKNAWNAFRTDNDSTFKVITHLPSSVDNLLEQHKVKFIERRRAYELETGLASSVPIPSVPKPPPPPGDEWWRFSTSTKILLGLAAALVVGGVGYSFYQAAQDLKRKKERLEPMLEQAAMGALGARFGGGVGGGVGGGLTGRGRAAMLAAGGN